QRRLISFDLDVDAPERAEPADGREQVLDGSHLAPIGEARDGGAIAPRDGERSNRRPRPAMPERGRPLRRRDDQRRLRAAVQADPLETDHLVRLMTWKPNCVSTMPLTSPTLSAKAAFSNGGTMRPLAKAPRSPPRSLFDRSSLYSPASFAKSPP